MVDAGVEVGLVGVQVSHRGAAHIERRRHWEQLVATGDLHLRGFGVLGGEEGFGIIAKAGAFNLGQMVAHPVLRLDGDRHDHDGMLWHPIQHGELVVADQPLQGELAEQRGLRQPLHGDDAVRDVVEPPDAPVLVGDRQAQHQHLAEIVAERPLRPVARIRRGLQQRVGIPFGGRRMRVEPAEQPVVQFPAPATAHADARRRQRRGEPRRHVVQFLFRRQRPGLGFTRWAARQRGADAPAPAPAWHFSSENRLGAIAKRV